MGGSKFRDWPWDSRPSVCQREDVGSGDAHPVTSLIDTELPCGMGSPLLLALPGGFPFEIPFPVEASVLLVFIVSMLRAKVLVFKMFPCFLRCSVTLIFSCE